MLLNPPYMIRLPSKGIGADFIIFMRVLHHLCVDAIAVSARLEHDIGKENRLARLCLNSARERQSHFHVQVVAYTFAEFERAVILPNPAGLLSKAPVGV